MRGITKTFPLDEQGVDAVAEELDAFFTARGLDKSIILRARFAAEELLLCVMEHADAPKSCTLTMGTRFGRASADIQYEGDAIDPSHGEDEWSARMLPNVGLVRIWS